MVPLADQTKTSICPAAAVLAKGKSAELFNGLTSIDKDVLDGLLVGVRWVWRRTLVEQVDDLVNFCREEVQGRQDAAVRSQVVLLHDLLIVDRVADVNVAFERDVEHSGIQVDHVWGILLAVQV